MPKIERVSFSNDNFSVAEAAAYYNDVESALRLFFSPASPSYNVRFPGSKPSDIKIELDRRLSELDRSTTMSILTAVEAAFRIDYIQRCDQKKKDAVSQSFWELYQKQKTRVSLEDDIFEVWKNNTTGSGKLIADLRGAFKFRHWMAHGRYWTPKLGKKYDFLSVYPLALQAVSNFPLMPP